MLKRFLTARGGNVAMMFGLMMIPLLIGAGVGFDTMRAGQIRSTAADAADAALLAASRSKLLDATLTDANAEVIARRYFDNNGLANGDLIIDSFDFDVDPVTGEYKLTVIGRIRTTLMRVAKREYVPLNIVAIAEIGPPRILEVVLALDNTHSMKGAKLTSLKSSANLLVDKLMADTDNTVLMGLVPFSNYVNVGLSRRAASWLDVADDYSTTTYSCWNTYPDKTQTNCVTTSTTCSSTYDGVTTTWACDKTTCDTDWGDPVEQCGNKTKNYTWRGCVGSRDDPWDHQDEGYATRPIPGLLNKNCPNEITPMTLDKPTITAAINAMTTQGNTYIAPGLMWAQRMISNPAPLTEGRTYAEIDDKDGIKAIILMTDGANTKSRRDPSGNVTLWPDGDHEGSSSNAANDKLEDACAEAKSKSIQLYTVAFEVTDTDIKDLLQDCATSAANYFDASDPAALEAAFDNIANQLQQLALTK